QQMRVALERQKSFALHSRFCRQIKAMNGVKEKQSPDALIQVLALVTERIEFRAGFQQLIQRCGTAERIQRLVPNRRIGAGNDFDERSSHFLNASRRAVPPGSKGLHRDLRLPTPARVARSTVHSVRQYQNAVRAFRTRDSVRYPPAARVRS